MLREPEWVAAIYLQPGRSHGQKAPAATRGRWGVRTTYSLHRHLFGDCGPFLWEIHVGEVDLLGWFEFQWLDEAISCCLACELSHGVSPYTEWMFGVWQK